MKRDLHTRFIFAAALLTVAMLAINGCSKATSAAAPGPPPEVVVAPVVEKDVPLYREWIGTLDGMTNAAIKAQVTGYLLTQNYTEGSFVKKGQLLFEIDPRPFQAAVDQAQGQVSQANGQLAQAKAQLLAAEAALVSAQANQRRMQLDEDRYVPLVKQQAVTQQDLDNATQNNLAAKAQVEQAKAQIETAKAQIQASTAGVEAAMAALETAKVNLGFTKLTSPIDGIAGAAQTQVGNLVSQSANTITTVSTLDPVKVFFTVSEQEYLAFTHTAAPGGRAAALDRLKLELILADGSVFPHPGKFSFADREVNQATGAIQLIGLFPNPGNTLRPGQYAKVRAAIGVKEGALLVPQRAVTELQGTYQVATVSPDNKVGFATVKPGDRIGTMWIINEGLKPGQRVIAEGAMKVGPGMPVTPVPYTETKGTAKE